MKWDEVMKIALLADKHEFVKLFLENSVVDFEEYLDVQRLLNLYNCGNDVCDSSYLKVYYLN